MKIRVDEIKEKGLTIDAEESVSEYEPLVEMEKAGECRFLSPLSVHLEIKKEYGHIRVTGNVQVQVALSCACCLADYELKLNPSFTVFYTQATVEPQDEEVELSEQELVSVTFSGDEIDLGHEIVEQVLLEVPFKPLCKEDCRGLCSQCGADLNVGECGCDRQPHNIKFSALKNFKVDR